MVKILKYTEYLYLIVAIISLYRVYADWNVDRQFAYIFIFFTVVSIGMFLFRRNYRKKFENYKKNNKPE